MDFGIRTTCQLDLVSSTLHLEVKSFTVNDKNMLTRETSGSNHIDEPKLEEISNVVEEAGVPLRKGGWEGGVVWLVPTDRPIDQWTPIATIKL